MKKSLIIMITLICFVAVLTVSAPTADIYPEGMVSCWKFDESSGTTAYDFLGVNNGTANKGLRTAGQIGSALSFLNGTWQNNNVVVIQDNGSLDFTGGVTVEAWLYGTNLEGFDNVFMKTSYKYPNWYDNGYGMYYFDGNIYFFVEDMEKYVAFAPFSQNKWHHVVGTYDGTTIRMFVDSVEGTSFAYAGGVTNIKFYVLMGGSCGYEYWGGMMDEVAVYNRVLSHEEIEGHYQDGLGGLSYCFSLPDADDDLFADNEDNCPGVYNPEQADSDNDGVGDICDNCPFAENPGQSDANENGVGDACDSDANWLKQSAVSMLENAKDGNSCKPANIRKGKCHDTEIDKVIEAINQSLTPAYWVDADSLNPENGQNNGKQVFIYESQAVSKCMRGSNRAIDPVCWDVSDALVLADEILAETAIADAYAVQAANPGDQKYFDNAMDNASKQMLMAAEATGKNPSTAITHYKNAWEFAQKAVKYQPSSNNNNSSNNNKSKR